MIKIESIDANVFALDGNHYLKGDYALEYKGSANKLSVCVSNKFTGESIGGSKNFVLWSKFGDSTGTAYANVAAFKTAIASIVAKTDNLDGIASDKGVITQATNVTTAVVLNTKSGVITTQAQTLAADAQNTFTVTNSKVAADSVVLLSSIYPSASAGSPVVRVGAISAGSFTVVVTNAGTAALNAALKIGFAVL